MPLATTFVREWSHSLERRGIPGGLIVIIDRAPTFIKCPFWIKASKMRMIYFPKSYSLMTPFDLFVLLKDFQRHIMTSWPGTTQHPICSVYDMVSIIEVWQNRNILPIMLMSKWDIASTDLVLLLFSVPDTTTHIGHAGQLGSKTLTPENGDPLTMRVYEYCTRMS